MCKVNAYFVLEEVRIKVKYDHKLSIIVARRIFRIKNPVSQQIKMQKSEFKK